MWPPPGSRTVRDLRTSETSDCLNVRDSDVSPSTPPSRSKWPTPCLYRVTRVMGRFMDGDSGRDGRFPLASAPVGRRSDRAGTAFRADLGGPALAARPGEHELHFL